MCTTHARAILRGTVLMTLCAALTANFVHAQESADASPDVGPVGMERAKIDDLNVIAAVRFAFDSAALTAKARMTLDTIAGQMRESPERLVELGGHTDSSGPELYNKSLSEQRAETVRQYLVNRGVAAGRVTAIGYGANQPMDTNNTAQGRGRNRRVDLKVPG